MRSLRLDHHDYVEERVREGGFGRVHYLRRADGRMGHTSPYLGLIAAKSFRAPVSQEDIWHELSPWLDLRHTNVVPLLAIGVLELQTVAVMPMREGSLADLLMSRGPLSPKSAMHIARQTLLGLKYAFDSQHLLHLDIKPGNILVGARNLVQVADWGIARMSGSHLNASIGAGSNPHLTQYRAGTLPFMAPERFSGAWALDIRADLFSIGMLMFQLVTGVLPFRGDATFPEQLIDGSYFQQAHRLLATLSPDVRPAILRLMAPTPGDRPKSHTEAIELLL